MLQNIKLVPILVGVAGAIVLALSTYFSWIYLIFSNKQIQDGMRIDLRNLESVSTKGVYAAEVMLAGGAIGVLLVILNFVILPAGLGFLVRKFAKSSERLHGATLAIGLFVLWSLGAVISIPAEPLPIGSSYGVWIALALYAVSALSIYVGSAGVALNRR